MESRSCKPHEFKAHENDFAGEPNFKCEKCDVIISAWEMTWYRRGLEHAENKVTSSEFLANLNEYLDEEVMKVDGFDNAIIGIVSRCGFESVLCYSREKIIDVLMNRDGMDSEEAAEYYDFNIAGSYVGKGTPMFLDTGF